MNDEEFKKKLESILGNLYRIDQEVTDYLKATEPDKEKQKYKKPLERENRITDVQYKT